MAGVSPPSDFFGLSSLYSRRQASMTVPYHKKNVAIIIPLKDACALSFFKGALLKDSKHILKKIGEHTQGKRLVMAA